ncbi:MAG: hypothetical protein N2110_04565 [Flavobacteriales bacterium]|nr:hypothetical protein [Flavobacteriales bacterium]MCX7768283.1 hypothetical protein [Flavobacteriales bacterium]MDW8410524.1 hypothetical protein [Flavobacteriales bacterium]
MIARFLSRTHDLLGWNDTSAIRTDADQIALEEAALVHVLTEAAHQNLSALIYVPHRKDSEKFFFRPGDGANILFNLAEKRVFIIRRAPQNGAEICYELPLGGSEMVHPLSGEVAEMLRDILRREGGFYTVYPPETVGIISDQEHSPGMDPLRKLFNLLRLDRKDISRIYTYAVAGGILGLALPLGIQSIINLVMGARVSASLIFLIGVVLLAVFLSGVMQVMQLQITEALQQKIFLRSAYEYVRRAPAFCWSDIKNRYMPEQMNRFFDSLTIQKGIPKLLMDFTTALLQITFGILLLAFYHPLFLFLSIALVAALILVFRLTYRPGMKAGLQTSKYKYLVVFWLEEIARAAAAFKLAGDSHMPLQKMDYLLGKYLLNRNKYFQVLLTQFWYFIGFKLLISGTLLLAGSLLVINQVINLGQFVASEIVIILILNATEKLIANAETLFDVAVGTEKLLNVVELPLERRDGYSLSRPLKAGGPLRIKFDSVSFREEKSKTLELDNVSLVVEPGEKVAILSDDERYGICISELLAGLEKPLSGQIFVGDMPLQNISLRSLRQHVAGVFIYDSIIMGTVLENIHLGRRHVSLEKVMEVVEALNIHRHLPALEKGLETELLPQDRSVSQILLRKILLARALVEQAGLVLMEHFDTRDFGSDGEAIRNLLLRDRSFTLLAGTHDNRMVFHCDKLLWLSQGRLKHFGPPQAVAHDELLKKLVE